VRLVYFVGHEAYTFGPASKKFGRVAIQGGESLPCIDDEEDQVSLVDGVSDLAFDVFTEVVAVDHTVSASVDQLKVGLVDVADGGDAIASYAGGGFHDAGSAAHDGIEETTLSHIGPADNGDNR